MSGMRVRDLTLEWRGDRIQVARAGTVIASARWWEGDLSEKAGALTSSGDDAALWEAIRSALRREEDEIVSAAEGRACDARGVDIGQVDWMLSLTPRERLSALETHLRGLVPLLPDAPRD